MNRYAKHKRIPFLDCRIAGITRWIPSLGQDRGNIKSGSHYLQGVLACPHYISCTTLQVRVTGILVSGAGGR